jgi:hypothetical protein
MVPQGPRSPVAIEARIVSRIVIHLPCYSLENSPPFRTGPCGCAADAPARPLVRAWFRLLPQRTTGDFLVLVVAPPGPDPPSIRVGVKAVPDAACVTDAFGKSEREADPSLLRRVELLPGIITVRFSSLTVSCSCLLRPCSLAKRRLLRSLDAPIRCPRLQHAKRKV